MEINAHLEMLTARIAQLEENLDQMHRRKNAQELVISWILTRFPHEDVHRFLATQANNMEGHPLLKDDVELLDDLRESVAYWHALPASGE